MWWVNSGDPTELHQYLGKFEKCDPPFKHLTELYGRFILNVKEIEMKGAYYLIGETVPIRLPRNYMYQDYFILKSNDNLFNDQRDDFFDGNVDRGPYKWYKEAQKNTSTSVA